MEKEERMRWIVAQEGSRETYGVPLALHRLGQLRLLYADIWCRWGRCLLSRGPEGARALSTRFNPHIPADQVVSFSPRALLWRSFYHARFSRLPLADQSDLACRFGAWFAGRVGKCLSRLELNPEMDLFFGFNVSSLEALEVLRARRILTVLGQVDPGKVEEDIILEETERWPGWQSVPRRIPQSYWARLGAEWNQADLVMVNSEWSAAGLAKQGVSKDKIIVVPLAVDLASYQKPEPIKAEGDLKILWLGTVILRKGIQYLVEAARLLEGQRVEFLLAGPVGISDRAVRTFPRNMRILGRITRDQLSQVYRQAHVFVLPTVSDGFAVTQLEAMAHGLPVITTPNCGRVVTDGLDGLLVPARDSQALADALLRLNNNRRLVRDMSRNALGTVRKYDLPSNARLLNEQVTQYREDKVPQTACAS
jgi:glycosyltransferase involved in cell wall biosynthesis